MKKLIYIFILLISFTSFGQTSSEYFQSGYDKAENGDYYGAIADYTKSIELNPNAVSYNNRGLSKSRIKDYYGAIADYNKSIELDPNDGDAYFNRGIVKGGNLNDNNGAILDYTKAIEFDPDVAHYYEQRGISKYFVKDYYGSISDYNKAIELDPNNGSLYGSRGVSKWRLGIDGCADVRKAKELGVDVGQIIDIVCNN